MRTFNYINDYSMIPNTIKGYIIELIKELKLLVELEKHPYYQKALDFVKAHNKQVRLNTLLFYMDCPDEL